MDTYKGYIRSIRFYSEETGFIVASVEVEDENEFGRMLTVSGHMQNPNDYDKYSFSGEFTVHPRYGKQFLISSYEVLLATDSIQIIKYLSSPLFPGVGTVQATNIVDTLGDDCLELILEDKNILDNVTGMTVKKRDTIYEVLLENKEDQEITKFFMGHGVSMKSTISIVSFYKEKTIHILQTNPYQLIDDIDGIGFKIADNLALKLGIKDDDPNRIQAAIVYAIKQGCFQSGSSYVDIEMISNQVQRLIYNCTIEDIENHIEELATNQKIIVEANRYYDYDIYCSEMDIVAFIKRIKSAPEFLDTDIDIEKEIKSLQKDKSISYGDKQIEAIKTFMQSPCMILTGGPGTGKTTIVKAMLDLYQKQYPHHSIALLAPTGRAAKRLTQLTGIHAVTIHRLLKWDLHTNSFAMDKNNPIEADVLVIDESSMIDSLLLANLFRASRDVYKVLFVGDHHQLPSVAPGNVLHDLMQCDIKTIILDKIYRQSEKAGIVDLTHRMINDDISSLDELSSYDDTFFFPCVGQKVIDNTTKIVNRAIQQGYQVQDIQVLAPMYQGIAGIDSLNEALQDVFNPDVGQESYSIGQKKYRIGDKILQLKNRPEDDVFNGDIGELIAIERKDGRSVLNDTLIIDFDGQIVEYTSKNFQTITHAYCMSIHKSQGSEFKVVIVVILPEHYIMLRRNLIYTAFSRAKDYLFILGQESSVIKGIKNIHDNNRKTTLIDKFTDSDELSLNDFM